MKKIFFILWCINLQIINISSTNVDKLVKIKSSNIITDPLLFENSNKNEKYDFRAMQNIFKTMQELTNQLLNNTQSLNNIKNRESYIETLLKKFNANFEYLVQFYLDQLENQHLRNLPKKRVNRSKRQVNSESLSNKTDDHNATEKVLNNNHLKERLKSMDFLRMGYDSTEDQFKRDPLIRMGDDRFDNLKNVLKSVNTLNSDTLLNKPDAINKLLFKIQKIEDSLELINSNLTIMAQSLDYIASKFHLLRARPKNQENIEKGFASNCNDLFNEGFVNSGVYEVKPNGYQFLIYCDMETKGGSWAYIHNRFDGSQEFMQDYNSYKVGFGNLAAEFWLGLDKIYALAGSHLNELLIELTDTENNKAYAYYDSFSIGSEAEGYPLKVLGGFSGEAGDSLKYHAGCKFSTVDMDQDEWPEGNCAKSHNGAWWYRSCDTSNLNGKYLNGSLPDNLIYQGMYWNDFQGPKYSLMGAKMMIRPRRQRHT